MSTYLTRSDLAMATIGSGLSFRNKTLSPEKTTATVELWLNTGANPVVSAQLYGLRFDAKLGTLGTSALTASAVSGWSVIPNLNSNGGLEIAAYASNEQKAVTGEVRLLTLSFNVSQASASTGFLVGFDVSLGQYELGYSGNTTSLYKALPGPVNVFGYDMSGVARYWGQGAALMKSFQIKLQDSALTQSAATSSTGGFSFSGVESSQPSLSIDQLAVNDASVKAAINLSDVLDALKLYLNKQVTNPSPYRYFAADLDQNGVVSLSDVLGLLKVYLNKPVAKGPEWVLLDAAAVAAKAAEINATHCATPALSIDLSSDDSIELVGVLRGDVNGSWVASS
jgi:hypothetical protein